MNSAPRFDVAICGAGPAGAATALSLKQFAPEVSVCLIDGVVPGQSVGEALPPLARPVIEHLGLWPAFADLGAQDVYRSHSAWGQPALGGVEFLNFPLAQGWTLDRRAFNAMLDRAASAVVEARILDQVRSLTRDPDGFVLRGQGEAVRARLVVDATGRSAAISRLLGHRPHRTDRLLAYVATGAAKPGTEAGVMVETCADGWWYTSAVPNGRRVCAFLTDTDIGRVAGLSDPGRFAARLVETRYIRVVAGQERWNVDPVPAACQILGSALPGIISVGDAAATFDPISSCGILRALRSGIFASYAIRDDLRGDQMALNRYQDFLASEWRHYRKTWAGFYAQETRWSDSDFWARRQVRAGIFVGQTATA